MRFRELRLLTARLTEQKEFYTGTLGLPLVDERDRHITIQAGETQLVFTQVVDGSEPYYHFAFNIPENKLAQAKEWLAARHVSLSKEDADNWYSQSSSLSRDIICRTHRRVHSRHETFCMPARLVW